MTWDRRLGAPTPARVSGPLSSLPLQTPSLRRSLRGWSRETHPRKGPGKLGEGLGWHTLPGSPIWPPVQPPAPVAAPACPPGCPSTSLPTSPWAALTQLCALSIRGAQPGRDLFQAFIWALLILRLLGLVPSTVWRHQLPACPSVSLPSPLSIETTFDWPLLSQGPEDGGCSLPVPRGWRLPRGGEDAVGVWGEQTQTVICRMDNRVLLWVGHREL